MPPERRRFRRSVRIAALSFVVRWALRVLRWTTRRTLGPDAEPLLAAFAEGRRVVVAFWHGHIALVQLAYPGGRLCVQVSRHSDGEIIARAIAPLGIRSARGSTTRGGVAGLREMLRAFGEGYDLAMAVDGPRGPRYEVKPGAVQLAAATGAPIYPVAALARRQLVVRRSWDHFVVPFPFTRIDYAVGQPIVVDRDAADGALEEARIALERELRALGARAGEPRERPRPGISKT